MRIAVIAHEELKNELLAFGAGEGMELVWVKTTGEEFTCEICIDLEFESSPQRIAWLQRSGSSLLLIHDVIAAVDAFPVPFVRFNGWKGFLDRPVVEAACPDEQIRKKAEEVFAFFNRKIFWVPDVAGFIAPRVVSMIINEAYFALEEQISTREEIDTAMKLGTNYPYGPFEWANRVGLKNIHALLGKLAQIDVRYQPCERLKQEAMAL